MSRLPAPLPQSAAKPIRYHRRSDYEFLPAVVEILETPLSPIRMSFILTLCAFTVLALAWSYVGRIDIIATAQGKLQPVGRTKTIQPLATGKVIRLAVQNGARVHVGDVLVELDAGEEQADQGMYATQVVALKAEGLRRKAALQAATTRQLTPKLPLAWEAGTPNAIVVRETRVLVGDLAQLAASLATLQAQAKEKTALVERLKGTVTAQETLVATLKQRVDMRIELLRRAAGSKALIIDAQESYQSQLASLSTERGELGEAQSGLATAQSQIERTTTAFIADNADKLAKVEREIDDDTQKLARASVRSGHMELKSPIDGQVQGLVVTTLGQVVTSGEQLMQIVPKEGTLEIEAYLTNGDAGFVHVGQSAIVKIQSFPFTDYGTISGAVMRVADDAIPLLDAETREGDPAAGSKGSFFGGGQRVQNLVFPVTLSLDRTVMKTEEGAIPLTPGMAVTVEIKTGSRRILSFLIAPIIETFERAFRER